MDCGGKVGALLRWRQARKDGQHLNFACRDHTVDCKTTEAGAKWMARAPNLGGVTTNVK